MMYDVLLEGIYRYQYGLAFKAFFTANIVNKQHAL